MKRHYFISDDLSDLSEMERELQEQGVSNLQIHVLSENDGEVEQRSMHDVNSLMKRDVWHSWGTGAVVGVGAALLVLLLAYVTGLTSTTVGWLPFVFLAIIVLGFCVWQNGLFGLRKPNVHFRRFEADLKAGKHVFFVEISPDQEDVVADAVRRHPRLMAVGSEKATPEWLIGCQKKWRTFTDEMP